MRPLLVTPDQPHGLVPVRGLTTGRSPIGEPLKLERQRKNSTHSELPCLTLGCETATSRHFSGLAFLVAGSHPLSGWLRSTQNITKHFNGLSAFGWLKGGL